jgi:hypothetical protein
LGADGVVYGGVKISNFNDYRHVFNDKATNDANVQWIVKLRDYQHEVLPREEEGGKGSVGRKDVTEPCPPSVYYKGASHASKKVVTDFVYKGNHLDVAHLSAKRIGPTPHLSQL